MARFARSLDIGGRARGTLALACFVSWMLTATSVSLAAGKLTFVDLQLKANVAFSDDLHEDSKGNNLANLPQGELKFEDVRFSIGERFLHVRGKMAGQYPQRIEGVKIGARCDRLHILHSTGFGEGMEPKMPDGTEIGTYIVHYEDKTSVKIPIVYGEDLRDWWDWPDRTELKRAKIAWTGTNTFADQSQRKVRLFAVKWDNPHPDKTITSLDMETRDTDCDPFLAALTLEKK